MSDIPTKHLCIHGHFYQPPREDPFTHRVPEEQGAAPYANFNEKITAECYRPNAEAGNFELMSFDFGPTLALWLEQYAPDVYHRIIDSDRIACQRDGIGNAIAHAYNHTILPLATSRDKRTQIKWGITDFQHRFQRLPEGMWLAETAVDMETLEILADEGIKFTILAPWQAASEIDTSEPYWVKLAGDRRIAVFFYNGPISGDVSFADHITANADAFAADTLANHINWEKAHRDESQILTVATDGELYGHHKLFRDRFLSHLLHNSAEAFGYHVTSLGKYFRDHPPTREAQIYAPSAWSCVHGVARWSNGCSCTEGDASWKPVLRNAMRELASRVDSVYEDFCKNTLSDPWAARNDFIAWRNHWITSQEFWSKHGIHGRMPSREDLYVKTWHMLEAIYHVQSTFTSCGWFFEDLDRIEPRNNINYARCSISHIWQSLHINLQTDFVSSLIDAHGWRNGIRGDQIYTKLASLPISTMLPPLQRTSRKEPAA